MAIRGADVTRQGWYFALLLVLAWLLVAGLPATGSAASGPAPAELPPEDFPAAQYIDSAGCVFMREQTGWTARLSRDGQAICGYPPTLSARRTAPEQVVALHPDPPEPPADRITRELVTTVMTGLQTGELVSAAPQVSARDNGASTIPDAGAGVAAAPRSDLSHLPAMIAAAPALQRAVASTTRGQRLCDLLGAAAPDGTALDGAAMGACGGLRKLALDERREPLEPADAEDASGRAPEPGHKEDAERPVAVASSRVPRPSRRAGVPEVTKTAGQQPAPGVAPVGRPAAEPMIPAGARYVQVGAFADDGNALRTVRRIVALGLPVARGRMDRQAGELQLIMAGPFDGRQALVRALHRLRAAGFATAHPR